MSANFNWREFILDGEEKSTEDLSLSECCEVLYRKGHCWFSSESPDGVSKLFLLRQATLWLADVGQEEGSTLIAVALDNLQTAINDVVSAARN